jgi:hypothetical protein
MATPSHSYAEPQKQRKANRTITGTGVTPIRITTGADLAQGALSVGAKGKLLRSIPQSAEPGERAVASVGFETRG